MDRFSKMLAESDAAQRELEKERLSWRRRRWKLGRGHGLLIERSDAKSVRRMKIT